MAAFGNTFLPRFGSDLEFVRPHLREVTLRAGQVLCEPGECVRNAYFLQEGVVSKLVRFSDGSEIECALVGREGVLGAMAVLGPGRSVTRDVSHMRVQALTMPTAELAEAARRSQAIHIALDAYCAFKMTCAVRNGACNAVHMVEHRLCRWLLQCADVLSSCDICLSQAVFARMIGVRRTSINPILRQLSAEGLVELARTRVTLLQIDQLKRRACECYASMHELEVAMLPSIQQLDCVKASLSTAAIEAPARH